MTLHEDEIHRYIDEVRRYKHQAEDEYDPFVIREVLKDRKCDDSLINDVIRTHGRSPIHVAEDAISAVSLEWNLRRPTKADTSQSSIAWKFGSRIAVTLRDAFGNELAEVVAVKKHGTYGFVLPDAKP